MTTIRFTKEQLIARAREKVKSLEFAVAQTAFADNRAELEEELELARIALASLNAMPVAWTDEQELRDVENSGSGYLFTVNPITQYADPFRVIKLFTVPPAPVVPDGYVLVPIEPTESMIVDGFESEPDKFFSKPEEWKAYEAMSGCQQAAHRAKLCWAAMLAAAPKPE